MSESSPILSLPYLMPSQAQKHVTHNEALRILDAVVQLRLTAFDAETPPADPDPGAAWALGASPTGAWAGQPGKLAIWQGEGWLFLTPQPGWRAWGIGEAESRIWEGSAWIRPPHLGINTSADAGNRLAVAAPATLLTHEGAGHQLKINKASNADTGAVLFQSNWSGRAEMGLLGNDDFTIKVSSDGTTWAEAIRVAGADGRLHGQAGTFTSLNIGEGQANDIPMALYSNDTDCLLSLNDGTTSHMSSVAVLAKGDDLNLRAGGSNTITVAAGGNVGVGAGVAAPAEKLHLDAGGKVRVDGATSGYSLFGPAVPSGGAKISVSSGPDAPTFCDFDAPDISTAGLIYRFGRSTNTSSPCALVVYAHDGTNSPVATISSAGLMGIGRAPIYRMDVEEGDDKTVIRAQATNGSYSKNMFEANQTRGANTVSDFFQAYSGNYADTEFRLRGDGNAFADGSWSGGGADYAEWFEWLDGNPAGNDRRGVSVVLEGDRIRPAQEGEEPIGVISVNPSVVGDGDMDRWKGKYLRDDFGAYAWEDYEVTAEGGEIITQQRRKLNPAYDPAQDYTPRAERAEWAMVGLMGKLRLRRGQPVGARWLRMRATSDEIEEWLVR